MLSFKKGIFENLNYQQYHLLLCLLWQDFLDDENKEAGQIKHPSSNSVGVIV